MSERLELRLSTTDDQPALRTFLASESLPAGDVSVDRQEYVLAHSARTLVGCVGLEAYGDSGLLRSLAVVPAHRGRGLGTALLDRIVARALMHGVKTAYLLTTSAERYFLAHGFERVDRSEVPAPIAATEQFRTLCPATAVCFRRRLDSTAVHFSEDVLRLRPDVPGAAMWAVALEQAMLTYFEMQPHARFEKHRHASEQITMVLEGELFFELEGCAEVRVRAGEVIALPADVPHAAWTREQPARAVDAWSPPRVDLVR